jgi:hypothetical protein
LYRRLFLISFSILFLLFGWLLFEEGAFYLHCQSPSLACLQESGLQYILLWLSIGLVAILAIRKKFIPFLVPIGALVIAYKCFFSVWLESRLFIPARQLMLDLGGDGSGKISSILYRDLLLRIGSVEPDIHRVRNIFHRQDVISQLEKQAKGYSIIAGDTNEITLSLNDWQLTVTPLARGFALPASEEEEILGPIGAQLLLIEDFGAVRFSFQPYEDTLNFLQRAVAYDQLHRNTVNDDAELALLDWGSVYGGWKGKAHRALPWFLAGNLNLKQSWSKEGFSLRLINCAIENYYRALSFLSRKYSSEAYVIISNNLGVAYYLRNLLLAEPRWTLRKGLKRIAWNIPAADSSSPFAMVRDLNKALLQQYLEGTSYRGKVKKERSRK